MTMRSTINFPSLSQPLFDGQKNPLVQPASSRDAIATKTFIFSVIDRRRLGEFAGLLTSAFFGFIALGLAAATLTTMLPGEWFRVTASFAALSGFVYLALAVDAEDARNGISDALTGIMSFVLAYAALNGQLIFLALAFSLSILWVCKELWFKSPQELDTRLLTGWASFNLGAILALMLV